MEHEPSSGKQAQAIYKHYSVFQNILYCIKNTYICYPPLLFWCLLLMLTRVALPVLSTFLPKAVIDAVTEGKGILETAMITLYFTISIAAITGLQGFGKKCVYWHKYKMNTYYLRKAADKGLTTDYCNQENDESRKLQSESHEYCHGNFSEMTEVYDAGVSMLSNLLGFTVYMGILARLNLFIVLFLAATTLVSFFLDKQILKWAEAHSREKVEYRQKTQYITRISGDYASAKDIRIYDMSKWMNQIYQQNLKGLSGYFHRYTKKVFGVSAADNGLALLREGAAYAYLLALVFGGQISVADFVLYFSAITGFSVWLSGILGQASNISRLSMAVSHFRSFLSFPEQFQREGGVKTDALLAFPKVIELKNVCYRYPGAKADTLLNINLKINPAEHLAVVGLNGAGKTTLVKLICGLIDPTAGTVLYDGTDVQAYNRTAYYRLFSAVFQQFSILPATIEEIAGESAPGQVDPEAAENCLLQAGLWDKIQELPNGIKSTYSRVIQDDGIEFSGGELQKLLLARALYKNAPIMVLDEPTAALDPISESRLYETYHKVMENHSTVFISHRLASTRFCSRILLMDGGRIAEEGTHEQLLSQKGKYYELFETQAKYYREHPVGKEAEE